MNNSGWNDLSQAAEYLTLELSKGWTERQVLYACEALESPLESLRKSWGTSQAQLLKSISKQGCEW
jgi:hypothetical protein